jgi:hypothetical protein
MGLLLGECLEYCFSVLDVASLGRFVSPQEEQIYDLATSREVKPVTWPRIDAHFGDAFSNWFAIAKVPFGG